MLIDWQIPMSDIPFVRHDVLKEIATIGSGRAATSLADLVGSKVGLAVPDTRVFPFQKIGELLSDKSTEYFVLVATLDGNIKGHEYFLLAPQEARMLAGLLLGTPPEQVNLQDEMVQSSLKEVANILLSSYMNALSELIGITIMVNVPELSANVSSAAIDTLFGKAAPTQEVLYVKSILSVKNMDFNGHIIFVPEAESMNLIFKSLGLSEKP